MQPTISPERKPASPASKTITRLRGEDHPSRANKQGVLLEVVEVAGLVDLGQALDLGGASITPNCAAQVMKVLEVVRMQLMVLLLRSAMLALKRWTSSSEISSRGRSPKAGIRCTRRWLHMFRLELGSRPLALMWPSI
ncbi:hypothetical protein [Pseudenhygromyxa sp. WMMC2535]|uniref:hypothetical protein n=1 Tax=Pseudenhygromyxa sp. WMMC2535 TaxID=2712867 RepID=UPI0020D0255D|nr:hypothetical protein [Pseudenhygromyxa sp. WMMC2535]